MATIHPLAEFFNTPEKLQLMKNFVWKDDMKQVEIDIDRIEAIILKEVWEKLNKGMLKDLQEVIAQDVFEQFHEGLKKLFN